MTLDTHEKSSASTPASLNNRPLSAQNPQKRRRFVRGGNENASRGARQGVGGGSGLGRMGLVDGRPVLSTPAIDVTDAMPDTYDHHPQAVLDWWKDAREGAERVRKAPINLGD